MKSFSVHSNTEQYFLVMLSIFTNAVWGGSSTIDLVKSSSSILSNAGKLRLSSSFLWFFKTVHIGKWR